MIHLLQVGRRQCRRPGFDLCVGKIPWRRERLPTPVFWPGEFYGLYSCGVSKSWTRLSNFHFHFQPFTEWGGPSPVSLQHEARGLHFAQSLCLWWWSRQPQRPARNELLLNFDTNTIHMEHGECMVKVCDPEKCSPISGAGASLLLCNKSLPWSFQESSLPSCLINHMYISGSQSLSHTFIIPSKGPSKRSPPLPAPSESTL